MAEYITRMEDGAGNYHYPITKAEAVEFGDQTVAEVLDAQKKASNRNLLHNWNWGNPVNQRGHSGAVSDAYCIDRWKGNGTVTTNPLWTTLAAGTSMKQFIEAPTQFFYNRMFTVSIEDSDGNIESASAYWPTYSSRGLTLSSYTVAFENSTEQYMIASGVTRLVPIVTITATVEKNIRAVKLEQGDKSTLELDTIADYSEQLNICNRYYHVLGTADKESGGTVDLTYCHGFITAEKKSLYVSTDLPVAMRTTPQLVGVAMVNGTGSGSSYPQTRGVGGYLDWTNANITPSIRSMVGTHLELLFEKTAAFGGTVTNNSPVTCGVTGALSADF